MLLDKCEEGPTLLLLSFLTYPCAEGKECSLQYPMKRLAS